MKKIKLYFDIRVGYRQHTDMECEIHYFITEKINSEWSLKRAVEFVNKKYNIKIGKEQEKCKTVFLDNYLFRNEDEDWFKEFEYDEEKALNTSIKCLSDYFNISDKVLEILYIDGIGYTSGDIEGIKFFFHPNEAQHNRRHIHCEYSGVEIRIDLDTLEVLDKPFKKSKLRKALDCIKKNREGLIETWDKTVKQGLPFEYKMII